jgi:hypothetical protein
MSKHMTNNNYTELSHSDDCEKYVNQFIQEFPLRSAEIGQGTVIKRALPSRHKRMIGANIAGFLKVAKAMLAQGIV